MPPHRFDPSNIFGRLLRLWRTAAESSQEDLAHALGVSTRHLSFLETGRATANSSLILALTNHFRLGEREQGNLMQAAGLTPVASVGDLNDHENAALRQGLVLTLKALDPFAAAVIDPCANVKLVNRGWVLENRRIYGSRAMDKNVNTIKLLVSEYGRFPDPGLQDLICLYLVILQQEVIIRGSEAAAMLIAEITALSGVPENWLSRGAAVALQSGGHNHREVRRDADGERRAYLNVHQTVGSTPYVAEPRLLIHILLPEDGIAALSFEALMMRSDLDHPLLAQ